MPSRRAYLGSLTSLVAGTAGCTTRSGQSSDTESPTATTPNRPDITVETAAVQYSYRHVYQVDWNDVAVARDQFVFVVIDAPEGSGAYLADEFRLLVEGELYSPKAFDRHTPADPVVEDEQYEPGAEHGPSREGWLCFQTPSPLDAQPTLLLETDEGTWEWAIEAPRATRPEPEWEWAADAPDTVAAGEEFALEITAENVGGGPGVFRGAVNFSHPSYRPKGFEVALDTDESGRTTVPATTEHTEPGEELTYRFVTAAGETKLTVTVERESETSTATSTA